MRKWANNAVGQLASGISDVAVSLSVQTGQGALFPTLSGAPDHFMATLIDSSNNFEIVKVTARTTDTFTIVRQQEGTAPRAFSAGDRVELRQTAAGFNAGLSIGAVQNTAVAGGTANALAATFANSTDAALQNGMIFRVQAASNNTTATPTLNVTLGSTATGAKTIVKGANEALEPGDIPGAGFVGEFQYVVSLDKYVLLNPAGKILRVAREALNTIATGGASQALNLASFNAFHITLTAASCALSFTNLPASGVRFGVSVVLKQDGTGGRLVDWTAIPVKWPDNVTPILTPTAGKEDSFLLVTDDGGTSWRGYVSGINF